MSAGETLILAIMALKLSGEAEKIPSKLFYLICGIGLGLNAAMELYL